MKVGILGSGDVGKAIARGFASRGHDVRIASRSPAKLREWAAQAGGKGKLAAATFAEAAQHGEVLVLATLGSAAEEAIALAGPGNFEGKLLLDTTNPLDFGKGMPPGLFVGTTDSLGERVQRKLPKAKVVKAFNTVPNAQMVDPRFDGPTPPMLIAGDDPRAKQQAGELLEELGWPGVLDVGNIEGARWLEAYVPLWVRVGAGLGTWDHVLAPLRPRR